MSDPVDALILNLLEWIGNGARPYTEVIEAWRTSCPRLPVWEEANERGFVDQHYDSSNGRTVSVSALGFEHLHCVRMQTTAGAAADQGPVEALRSLPLSEKN
jgi:D-3-phosphoglycerate dehydrogenase / 2-oxoglutarate reductase